MQIYQRTRPLLLLCDLKQNTYGLSSKLSTTYSLECSIIEMQMAFVMQTSELWCYCLPFEIQCVPGMIFFTSFGKSVSTASHYLNSLLSFIFGMSKTLIWLPLSFSWCPLSEELLTGIFPKALWKRIC